jgi:hypothetical protein
MRITTLEQRILDYYADGEMRRLSDAPYKEWGLSTVSALSSAACFLVKIGKLARISTGYYKIVRESSAPVRTQEPRAVSPVADNQRSELIREFVETVDEFADDDVLLRVFGVLRKKLGSRLGAL